MVLAPLGSAGFPQCTVTRHFNGITWIPGRSGKVEEAHTERFFIVLSGTFCRAREMFINFLIVGVTYYSYKLLGVT